MRHGSDCSLRTCRIYHLVIPFSSTSIGRDWNPLPESLPGHWKTFFVTEPLRLAGIAEKLPEQIDAHYSAVILNVFAKKEVFDAVGFETVEAVAEKFTRCMTAEMDYELASGFCGLLINHPGSPLVC